MESYSTQKRQKFNGFHDAMPTDEGQRRQFVSQLDALAERQGFEPWIRFWRILTFQASAFDHSATSPHSPKGRTPLAAPFRFRKAQ